MREILCIIWLWILVFVIPSLCYSKRRVKSLPDIDYYEVNKDIADVESKDNDLFFVNEKIWIGKNLKHYYIPLMECLHIENCIKSIRKKESFSDVDERYIELFESELKNRNRF